MQMPFKLRFAHLYGWVVWCAPFPTIGSCVLQTQLMDGHRMCLFGQLLCVLVLTNVPRVRWASVYTGSWHRRM